jgi:hypothetical protein
MNIELKVCDQNSVSFFELGASCAYYVVHRQSYDKTVHRRQIIVIYSFSYVVNNF